MYKQLSELSKQCVTLGGNLRGYNSYMQMFIIYDYNLWATERYKSEKESRVACSH